MIDFFSNLYASIRGNNILLVKMKYYSIERLIIRLLCNAILPIYLRVTSNNVHYTLQGTDKAKGRIIVSLTSFNRRIGRVWIAIESILRQTHQPDIIILWLSKEEFPTIDCVPKSLLRLQKRGVKIELRDGNLMSHKKYHYTLIEYPDDHMITIDDDIIYPSNFIRSLLNGYEQNPECVISLFSFKIRRDNDGEILPYSIWSAELLNQSTSPSFDIFFGSGGGTFFSAHVLGEEAKNITLAMEKCKFADDVWLNTMCRLNKKKIVVVDNLFSYLPILNFSNSKLVTINNGQNQNDVQLSNLREYYIKHFGKDPYSPLN